LTTKLFDKWNAAIDASDASNRPGLASLRLLIQTSILLIVLCNMTIHHKLATDFFCKAHTFWKRLFSFLYALYGNEYLYKIRVIMLRQLIQILKKQAKVGSQALHFFSATIVL